MTWRDPTGAVHTPMYERPRSPSRGRVPFTHSSPSGRDYMVALSCFSRSVQRGINASASGALNT